MSDVGEMIAFIACFLVGVVAFVAIVIVGVSYGIDRPSCYAAWTEHQPQWTLFGGCTVSINGERYPIVAVQTNTVTLTKP